MNLKSARIGVLSMIRKLIFVFIFIGSFSFAQYERPGSTDAQFLKIGVSARAAGMGGAYIAVVSGAEGAYYNPAALAKINRTDVVFTHSKWFAGINHEFTSVAQTFPQLGTFAISMTALYTDEMNVTTPLQPDGTGETFYSGNYRFGISYARNLTDQVSFGGTVNYINLDLYRGFTANAYSTDIGVLYVTQFHDFRFGMKIANFGTDLKFVNEAYPLPTNFTFGISINAFEIGDQKMLTSFSVVKPNDGKPLGKTGVEWNYRNIFFVRSGYRINHNVATYSAGAGIQVSINDMNVKIDYSLSNFELLGEALRFGLVLSF